MKNITLSHISTPLVLLWAAAVGAGVFGLAKYENTPGPAATLSGSSALPQSIGLAADKISLVMFVHPKCPCSEASLEELSTLMAEHGGRVNATVVMFRPDGERDDWSRTRTWAKAHRIRGVEVRDDVDATLAKKCGAQTSGQVFLYDGRGRLLFEGGITASRGHVGDNDGLEAVTKRVGGEAGAAQPAASSPVFGCPIYTGAGPQDAAGP